MSLLLLAIQLLEKKFKAIYKDLEKVYKVYLDRGIDEGTL